MEIVRCQRNRVIQVGHRVVVTKPGISDFRGVVAKVSPESVRVYEFASMGAYDVKPEHVRVQYGRIEAQEIFMLAVSERAITTRSGAKVVIPGPNTHGRKYPSGVQEVRNELDAAVKAMHVLYGKKLLLDQTHRLILTHVLNARKHKKDQPGFTIAASGWVACNTKSRVMKEHIEDLLDAGILDRDSEAAILRVKPGSVIDETAQDPIAAYAADVRNQEREDDMAKAKAKTADGEVKEKKIRKPKVDFSALKPEDFLRENAKGKTVFKPGHDARYAGILKRVAAGQASPAETKLAFAKALVEQVASSSHFAPLLEQARKAAGK